MPVTTTWIKFILIGGALVFFLTGADSRFLLKPVLPAAGLLVGLLYLFCRFSAVLRRRVPNAIYLFAFVLFPLLLWARLQLEDPVPEPPPVWYSLSRDRPVYDESLLAKGVVRRWIGPRLYLVDLRLEATQKKVRVRRFSRRPRYRARDCRRGPEQRKDRCTKMFGKRKPYADRMHPPRFHGERKQRGRRSRYSKGDARSSPGGYRKSYKPNKKKPYKRRSYYRKSHGEKSYSAKKRRKSYRYSRRWGRSRPVSPEDGRTFPVLLRVNEDGWHPGCRLELRVYGRGVPALLNTARSSGFADYVRRKGGASYLRLSRKYHVRAADCPAPGWRFKMRERLDGVLRRAGLETEEAAIARGLLLGRSGFLYGRTKRAARELGILHVFAASGLHLGIFFACIALPVGLVFGARHAITLCVPLPFCLAYLYFLGFPISLTRAFVFVSLFALQSLLPVYMPTLERLANTALCAVLIAPREFCSLSGALSFGAVAGILFGLRVLIEEVLRPRGKLSAFLCGHFAVSTAAALGTTPSLLIAFGAYSYGAQFANLIVVPLVGLVLPALYALIGLDLIGLPAILLDPVQRAVALGLKSFTLLTHGLGPFALYRHYPDALAPPLFYCLLLFATLVALGRLARESQASAVRFEQSRRFWRARARGLARVSILLLGPVGFLLECAYRIWQVRAVFSIFPLPIGTIHHFFMLVK